MKTRLHNIIALTIAFAVVAQLCYAEESVVSQEIHVHGLSELTIAMEGESLEIQFTSPAMNLLGFEHKASSTKDKATIKIAASILRQHETLFLFSGGRCDHVETLVDLSGLIKSDEHEHGHQKNSAEHENDDGHTKEFEEHTQKNNHRDAVARYRYRCENIAQLSEITVNMFENFPGIHNINAVWIKPMQQGAAALTPSHRIIEFR